MKKRTVVSIALAVALVLALAAPAFAQSMNYSAEYNFDGTIEQELQAGHLCNTGAELKQTIMGTGAMTKVMDVAMVQGKIAVSDVNDWVTSPNAVRNLTVTSVIELCAPGKMTYTDNDVFEFDNFEDRAVTWTGVVDPLGWYVPWTSDAYSFPRYWFGDGWTGDHFTANNLQEWDNWDIGAYEELTKQIWAVQVEAAPGFSGALHQDFEAAYGPFYWGGAFLGEDDDFYDGLGDHWTWMMDDDGVISPLAGDNYVGNYFNIDQFARTSQGVVKRFIEVSSPWSHAYLTVDSTITGMSEQTESFKMDNLEAGSDAADNWWNLF